MAEPEISELPAATAQPAARPAAAAPRPASRLGSLLWPLLGGVIAAGLGFALARAIPGGWPIADTSALQAQVQQVQGELAALQSQLDALASRSAADTGLADRVAALEARPLPPDLSRDLAEVKAQLADLSAMPGSSDATALKALQDQVAALASAPASVPAEVEAAIAAARDQLSAATAEAEARVKGLVTAAALRQLSAALDSGAPYAAALADLADQDLPAVLTDHAASGLPTLQSLRASFPDAARASLEDARRADMGASWTDRIATFLQAQTAARSLTARQGNDPDAILSRAEAALAQGDLATALAEIAALPDAGKPAMAEWQAQAQLRLDAAKAIAGLGQAMGG